MESFFLMLRGVVSCGFLTMLVGNVALGYLTNVRPTDETSAVFTGIGAAWGLAVLWRDDKEGPTNG